MQCLKSANYHHIHVKLRDVGLEQSFADGVGRECPTIYPIEGGLDQAIHRMEEHMKERPRPGTYHVEDDCRLPVEEWVSVPEDMSWSNKSKG
jgi:hypothetical protein